MSGVVKKIVEAVAEYLIPQLQQLRRLDNEIKRLNERLDGMSKRLDELSRRLDGVVDRIDRRVDNLYQVIVRPEGIRLAV